jgi:hypothetical protein
MITGAACATINRLPVLIMPDIFARRNVVLFFSNSNPFLRIFQLMTVLSLFQNTGTGCKVAWSN